MFQVQICAVQLTLPPQSEYLLYFLVLAQVDNNLKFCITHVTLVASVEQMTVQCPHSAPSPGILGKLMMNSHVILKIQND